MVAAEPWPATLAAYVPRLRAADDELRLRLLLHEFGLRWWDTPLEERLALVADEPAGIDTRWDAFLAAWVEHHCWHDRLQPPGWVFDPGRYLDGPPWFPGGRFEFFRVEAVLHSPAAFEAHGVLLPLRELKVV